MNLTRLVTALAVAVTLTLAGCSDDPDPKLAPAETTSASPTPSETAARDAEEELIDQFVRSVSFALANGDPSEVLDLSMDSCENCQTLATNLQSGFQNGGKIVGGEWRVSTIRLKERTPADSLYYVDVKSERERWLDRNGELIKVVEAGTQLLALELRKQGGALRVADFRVRV